MTAPVEVEGSGRSYALLADGTTMTIRSAGSGDYEAVKRLHEAMSPDNLYFRFFSASPAAAEQEARRLCLDGGRNLTALLGLLGDELVGVASYEVTSDETAAEVALAVTDSMHGHGIATLLLEHLVSLARARGMETFVAEVLPGNYAVLGVLADAGLAVRRRYDDGVVDLSMPVPPSPALGEASAYLDAVAGRDLHAAVASLEPLLAPRSAVVIGSGRRAGSIGRTILLNIRDAGFAGALYAVNPHGSDIGGITCVASVTELPETPDLAVITVPARQVAEVARECGEARDQVPAGGDLGPDVGARSGSAGGHPAWGHAPGGPELLRRRRARDRAGGHLHRPPPSPRQDRAGGPVRRRRRGTDGAVSRLGIGTSSFVSVGDMLDVSGTDLLLWWEADQTTELAVLYLESFGNPRRFARTARRAERQAPHPDRARRAFGPGPACRRLAHRGGGRAADHPAGAVRPGGHHRHHQLRRAA